MDRREFIGLSLPAVAGAAIATQTRPTAISAQAGRVPAAAKPDAPKITDIRYFAAGPGYVKISTDDRDVFGWGELTTIPSHRVARSLVAFYKPLLIGMDPTRIEHIWQLLYRSHRNVRGGMLQTSAIGGIDMALWDLMGRLLDVPVYTLLCGPCRDKLLFYPHAKAHKQTSHQLHEMVERPRDLDYWVGAVKQTREKLGRDGYLMIDGHGKLTAQVAIQLCKQIEDQGILYFEEVVPPEQQDDLAKVKAATTVPLCIGERYAGIWPFRRVLEQQWVDVLNPDIVRVGGISQMKKLASIAELYDVPLAPHGTHSAVGLAATLHVCASINNFLIAEAYSHIVGKNPFAKGIDFPEKGGHLSLPPGPGLGVTVDEDALDDADRKWDPEKDGVKKAYFTDDGAVADR